MNIASDITKTIGRTPLTTISTLPSVSCQISSAVVSRWMSGLAGLSNWLGM